MLMTQADLEKHLQIDVTAEPDPVIESYIAQADAMITAYCGQDLNYDSAITETFEATTTTPWHILDRFPVSAIASVEEDDVALTVTDDYLFYPDGRLRRVSGSADWYWSGLPNACTVVYSSGYGSAASVPYDAVPDDLVLACTILAAALFRQGAAYAAHGANPVKSVSLDGSDTITYDTSAANQEPVEIGGPVAALLAPYRRRRM